MIILEFRWLNYTSRPKRRRWCRLIWSEIVHVQLSGTLTSCFVISLCDRLLCMLLTFAGVGEGYTWFRQLSFWDLTFAQRCEWSARASGTWRRINSFIGNKLQTWSLSASSGLFKIVQVWFRCVEMSWNFVLKTNCFHQWHWLLGHTHSLLTGVKPQS